MEGTQKADACVPSCVMETKKEACVMKVEKVSSAYAPVGAVSRVNVKINQSVQSDGKRDTYAASGDMTSFEEKFALAQEYQEMLERMKKEDPGRYQQMKLDEALSECKSIGRLTEIAEENGGSVTYNGVTLNFDMKTQKMCLGNMDSGDVINAGVLSNGYCFYFNRENIGDIAKILDLFSPEDVNKIMAAIETDNMADRMKNQVEDEKANGVQGAETAAED